MKRIYLVNHTHWDREWYFTTIDSLVLSDDIFTNIFKELQNDIELRFCLDGQSSILDDYINIRPEKYDLVKTLVKENRLEIGPWYTQTDAFFVDQESIIRNLIIGIRDSKKYGGYMNIGYLPDTFGLNGQLPTIFYNTGINNVIFRRGINFDNHVNSAYFNWEGISGKSVKCVNLVDGYGPGAFLSSDNDYLNERLIPKVNSMYKFTPIDNVIIPVGGDQLDIVPNLNDIVSEINNKSEDKYIISSYEELFKDIEESFIEFDNYVGEFREPTRHRVHKTIGSIRYDIKRENFLIEQKLLRRVEPMMSIARKYNIDLSPELLIKAWKKILEGHAHDSMGGCVSDDVAIDILHRMKEADEIVDGVENIILKRISEGMNLSDNEILILNTDVKKFSGNKIIEFMSSSVNIELIGVNSYTLLDYDYYEGKDNLLIEAQEGDKYINEDPYYKLKVMVDVDIPSMGYKVIKFKNVDDNKHKILESHDRYIENNIYRINCENEKINLVLNNRTIENFIQFETIGNEGDTYDFSPLKGDRVELLNLKIESVYKSDKVQTMKLKGKYTLPYDLESRLGNKNKYGNLVINMTITLSKNSELIDFKFSVDNNILSHRLRAKIFTDIHATETIASQPFGFIKRPVLKKLPDGWKNKYQEMPIDVEPFDKSVSVHDDNISFTILSKGIKEYQFTDKSLYLTMFSTTSQLGKPNLEYRPGRASGDTTKKGHVMIETPMAELQGISEFEFAVNINDKFDENKVSKLWNEYSDQSIYYQNQTLNKFINRLDNKIQSRFIDHIVREDFSLLEVDGNVYFSSFAPSLYDDDSFILRLQNPSNEIKTFSIYSDYIKEWKVVNNIEEELEAQTLQINKYDTLSLKIWFI